MQRIGKLFLRIVITLAILAVLLASITLAPVDRTLPEQQPFYPMMMQRLDSVLSLPLPIDTASLRVGFGKASITPGWPTATAGYVKRKGAKFTRIRDSVFVRVMIFELGEKRAAVASLDMLIVPPALLQMLDKELDGFVFPARQIFFGATHTHNSIGQWDNHLVGEVFAGPYDERLIKFLADQIKKALHEAWMNRKRARLYASSVSVNEAVTNRLIANGPVDSLLHVLITEREDGTRGIVTSYTAHATCLSSKDLRLSADYPGELVRRLEANGYDFALFLAGAVGSHAPVSLPDGDDKIARMSAILSTAAAEAVKHPVHADVLRVHHIPLLLAEQQIRVSPGWRVRSWLSEKLLGDSNPALSMLQIGNVLLIGTPCDFSGMLTKPVYEMAAGHNLHVAITSFNGGYIGYVTPDQYFDLNAYETQTMNWYGYGNGKYLTDCIFRIIQHAHE